jgi:hypothetical protein
MSISTSTTDKPPLWHLLAPRYNSERERLAAYLALETSEVLAGVKPANLLSMLKQRHNPEYDFYPAWQKYGRELLQAVGLQVEEMADRENSLLLFIYRPGALQSLLSRSNVRNFLCKAGYSDSGNTIAALARLKAGISKTDFPHEMGVFLGYPLKDVAGFMGWVDLPNSGHCLWKFYGNPERSIKLARVFRNCRLRMAKQLENVCTPFDCLRCEHFDSHHLF